MPKIALYKILDNFRGQIVETIGLLKSEWNYCLTDDVTLDNDLKDVADFRVNLLQYFGSNDPTEYFANMGYLIKTLEAFGMPSRSIYSFVHALQVQAIVEALPDLASRFELTSELTMVLKEFNKITGVVL